MPGEKQWLKILHTNDIHSYFEQMPKVAEAMDRLAEYAPGEVLRIDCGDHLDRMRMETEGSDGLANIEIMNQTGYEAVVLGNNEGLSFTPEVLTSLYGEHARFTVLGSNLAMSGGQPAPAWLQPYRIVRKGRLRIGLLGVTARFTEFYRLLGWDVLDPYPEIEKRVEQLRGQTDIIIVLSHLGLTNDQRMAESIDGIDLILGGHTHHLLEEPLWVNGTCICAAGKYGQYVGEVDISYDFSARSIAECRGRCVEVAAYADHPQILKILAGHRLQSAKNLSEPVTMLDRALPNDWYSEAPLSNLLAEGLRKWTETDIGLVNAGQLLRGLEPGEITLGLLHDICPSPINPCRAILKGAQIQHALEEALIQEIAEMPIRGFGFRGERLGTLSLDGVTVEYDMKREVYRRILSVRIGDSPLEPDRRYSVGMIDMFTFRVGYAALSEGENIRYYLPEFIRDILRIQLLDPAAIQRSFTPRWICADRNR